MAYEVRFDDDGKNVVVDVNGVTKGLGELTEKEASYLRLAGIRNAKTNKDVGTTQQLASLLVLKLNGAKIRKLNVE